MKRLMKNVMRRGRRGTLSRRPHKARLVPRVHPEEFTLRIHSEGFTLIEVMVALAVVTFGLVAVLGMLPVSLKSARDTADNTLAATIVQDVFTGVRSSFMTYTNPVTAGVALSTIGAIGSSTVYFDSKGNGPVAAGTNSYFQVNLTYEQEYTLSTLYRVTAVVTWPAHNPAGVTPSTLPGNTFVTEVASLH